MDSVSAIIVGYSGAPEVLAGAIDALLTQTLTPTQIICVDQSPDGRFDKHLRDTHPAVQRIRSTENVGYSSACNRAAQSATGEFLFFINPDTRAHESCVEILVGALRQRHEAAIAGAQILLPDGRVNAGDNSLHLTGLAWAGHYGAPPEQGPPRPAAVVSGAALLARRSAFESLGGYTEGFFMYHDDVELAWRARLAGWEVVFCPEALVAHDYEFAKGGYKWRYMERNRWWCLLAFYEMRTLLLLAPLLLAVEAAIWRRALSEGWLEDKLAAWRLLWGDRGRLRSARRSVQGGRTVGDHAIVERMTSAVDSPFIASSASQRGAPLLAAYRRLLLTATA